MAAIAVVCLAGGAVFGIAGPALADDAPVVSTTTSTATVPATAPAPATAPTDSQPTPPAKEKEPVAADPAPVAPDSAPAPHKPAAVVPQSHKDSTPPEPETSTKTDTHGGSCHGTDTKTDARQQTTDGNGCDHPLVATASVSFIDATCHAAEKLVLGEAINATWGAVTDPAGRDDYSVTATANDGAKFAGGLSMVTFHGKLDPVDHGRHCHGMTDTKVKFCHATGNDTNPYVKLHTSVKAFFQAGHDTHPMDIVPPFTSFKHGHTVNFPGLNWDAHGKAIFKNGCHEMPVPSVATATVSFTDATCTTAQQLVLGDVANATWGQITDPAGPDDYTVTATANTGAQFAGGLTELTFHGELNPIDNGPNCAPAIATATVSFTDATCTTAQQLVLGDVANATWGQITDPAGPDDYTVTATANTGAQFAGGLTELTFHGELNGVIDPLDPRCQLPTEALVLPVVAFTQFTCDSDGSITLGVAKGYNPTHVTFTVNGVAGIRSGTYAVTKAGTTTVTAQPVAPNGLEPRWVTPAAFRFAIPSKADCGVVTSTSVPGSKLAFTGVTDPIPALALGGGFLFLGITAHHLGRRRRTIK
ncbi:MAG: hypothetical protein JWQ47_2171 [Glaciihabitans sp.]|nr:hypothetical protein [Glaciihabitans sp.]